MANLKYVPAEELCQELISRMQEKKRQVEKKIDERKQEFKSNSEGIEDAIQGLELATKWIKAK